MTRGAGALCLVVLALLAAIARTAGGCDRPRPTPSGPPGGAIEVRFTQARYPDAPSERRASLNTTLADLIRSASRSVDMAAYELDLGNVTLALLDARSRGCTVRVVTDTDVLVDADENAAFRALERAGIVVVGGNSSAIMHNKFAVVDGTTVWTGSWNFTENDTYRNDNNGLLIRSIELARNYTVTFEKMWRDKRFGDQRKPGGTTPRLVIGGLPVESYFAPEDAVAAKIAARLNAAKTTIDFMAFSFTDDTLGGIVRTKAKAGLKVRGVFENGGSETQYSEFPRMKAEKLDVWQDGNPYQMHHKVFILDGKTVVTGSFNFSRSAGSSNDENLLIIDDAAIAGQYAAEFERVYAQAKNRPAKK